jgi:outer membrane protein assembly factor BamB
MKLIIIIALFISLLLPSFASDNFSQWRGPDRDGKYPETNLLQKWPSQGPDLIWTVTNLGEGFSSPAVTSKGVYVTGMIDGTGYLFAFGLDGKKVWRTAYGPEWDGGHEGARTTPTVVGDKIYIMSGRGNAVCINSTNGKIVWKVDLVKTFGARNLNWGMTESLLVDGDRVFCTPGGIGAMMVILNRFTGKTIKVIKGNGEKSAYCSPSIVSHNGKRLLITMTGQSLVGLDAENGDLLWQQLHRTRYDINPNTPLYIDGYVYAVSGYGTGSQLVKLNDDGRGIKFIWSDETLDSQMGAAVVVDGNIYGSGHKNKGWHCVEWKTGNVKYTSQELGKKGNIIFANGLLYCYSENGEVGLVRPNPNKFEIISSFKIDTGSGPHWAHPVISDGRLYVRHGDAMMVYDIRSKK